MEEMTFKQFLDIKHPIKVKTIKFKDLRQEQQMLISKALQTKTVNQVSKELNLPYNLVWRINDSKRRGKI